MLSLRLNHLAFFFCLFLALSPANAAPVVIKRQSDGQSTTVMTQSTTSTPVGDMTQTCVITLTPITVNGQQEVEEVKTCTLSMAAQNNSGSNGGDNGGNSTTIGGGSTNGGDTTSSSTDTGGSSTSTDTSTSTDSSNSGSTSTDTSGTAAPTDAGSPVSVNGLSTVTPASVTGSATDSTGASASASATATDSAAASTSATAAPANGAVSAGSVIMVPASSQNTAITAATQAADQAPSSSASAAFTVPGQKIQVLPIGLGVFAGISVIALIVVGLVTYERTKYRKAFRARKLAESGAGMGYGGMAQR